MWHAYVIKSRKDGSFFIGTTNRLERKLYEHNAGLNLYTHDNRPFKLVYKKGFENRQEAIREELKLKRNKSRSYMARLATGR